MSDLVEKVARAMWNEMREHEDRCDMELEDMGKDHVVWTMARIAVETVQNAAWQPIETAPKDGTRILTIANGSGGVPSATLWAELAMDYDDLGTHAWCPSGENNPWFHQPTHWMPFPPLPKA